MKPSSIAAALTVLVGNKRPGMIWGPPGVGKSDTVKQVAEKLGMEMRDVRLSLLDPTDLKGFPMLQDTTLPTFEPEAVPAKPATKNKTEVAAYQELVTQITERNTAAKAAHDEYCARMPKKEMNWAIPSFLPTHGEGILFLDELPSAPQSVQAAAYQLVLDRAIGDYKMPDGWALLAAGNRQGDRGVSHAMPSPLANRLVHLDYEIDAEDWQAWAITHGISDITRGFIRFRPNLLHAHDTKSNDKAFPTPRSWKFVDDVMGHGLSSDVEFELLKGTVGEGAASEYMAFAKVAMDLPSVDEILIAPDTAPVPEDPAGRYAICTALDKAATPNTMGRLLTYVERFDTEFQVLFMRSAGQANRTITQSKEFTAWMTKNRAVII